MQASSEEILELRRSVRDLVALTALPAVWVGYPVQAIGESLADALFSALRPDLLYICLQFPGAGWAIEVARTEGWQDTGDRAREVRAALGPWLQSAASNPPPSIANPAGSGTVRLAVTPIEYADPYGVVAAGSQRPDFPTERDRLLLHVAANQAAIAFHLYEEARGKAALEERQRLARQLHDSVSQVLYSIALTASTAARVRERDPVRLGSLLQDVLTLAEGGLAEMRALIFELQPEALQQEGLVAALEKQAAAVQARHGISVRTALGPEPSVPLAVKEALYRVVQEALHNTAKHARAHTVEVSLSTEAEELVLSVSDDGRGFDPTGSFPGHLGLRSMQERATAAGGTLQVESAPGQGTRVCARVAIAASR